MQTNFMVCVIGTGIVACTGGTIPEASIAQPDRPVPSSGRDEYGKTTVEVTGCPEIADNLSFTTGYEEQERLVLYGGGEAWVTYGGVFVRSNYNAPVLTTPEGYPTYKPWSFRGEIISTETRESMGVQTVPQIALGHQYSEYDGMLTSTVFASAAFSGGDLVCETCRYDIALQWTDTENPSCTVSAAFGDVLLRFEEGFDLKWRKTLPSERPNHRDTAAHTGGPG